MKHHAWVGIRHRHRETGTVDDAVPDDEAAGFAVASPASPSLVAGPVAALFAPAAAPLSADA